LGIHFPAAGKTGTTNEFKDGWFVGYTPEIMALIWVGFDDGTPLQAPASALTLPMWADLMNAIPQHISGSWFKAPPDIVVKTICKESGELAVASSGCRDTLEEVFLAGNAPKETSNLHQGLDPIEGVIKRVKDFLWASGSLLAPLFLKLHLHPHLHPLFQQNPQRRKTVRPPPFQTTVLEQLRLCDSRSRPGCSLRAARSMMPLPPSSVP
jgi:membrane peptidoglycan carboxypeptidase